MTSRPGTVCVFCGSNVGADPRYREAATALGKLLAQRQIGIVYGGGRVGLMGVVADSALEAGGQVVGVIPEAIAEREVAHHGLTDLIVVGSMHARKAMMAERADAFVALPGGLGTFEELLEVLTWSQLGIHQKPVGLLNVAGYYDPLLALIDRAITDRFMPADHRGLLIDAAEPEALLNAVESRELPSPPRKCRPFVDLSKT